MRTLSQEDAEQFMLQTPSVANLRHWSKLYSSGPHLAGDKAHAERIRDLWRTHGIPTHLVRYDVLQNFPVDASLKLHSPDGTQVDFEASLTEDAVPDDPTSAPSNGLPVFHGFGANGTATAELVYANFGTVEDFRLLASRGVDVRGKVVLCKYAKIFRGLKVRAAQRSGAVAVVLYNDPQEDGEYTARNGYEPYPHGPARHPKSVQRGSVDFFSVSVGDPTTPGYPSLPGGDGPERRDPRHAIPTIPSLPISFADALPLLKALNGCGLSPEELGADWRGELDGADYCTGPSDVKVTLHCESTYRYSPIYNVIGEVLGRTEEVVFLGSHHDSWSCGAVDPVSGSAAMNEVARGLGELLKHGWKPLRKIIVASWDNEEYGLVGSTEYAEQFAEDLSKNCVAYINVDESTNGGKILGAIGSPLLAQVLDDVTRLVPSPVREGATIHDDWSSYQAHQQQQQQQQQQPATATSDASSHIGCMGTGSDYTAFFHHLGIPSLDLVFNKQSEAVYPYHSNYDSHYWLDKFGDPGFGKHLAMARLWGVLAVRLAGLPIVPFRATHYAGVLGTHVQALRDRGVRGLDLGPLSTSVSRFATAVASLDRQAAEMRERRRGRHGVSELNARYTALERAFLLPVGQGLPGRPWYRHPVFAPGLWYGYDGVVFPGIIESLDDGDVEAANEWVEKVAVAVDRAGDSACR